MLEIKLFYFLSCFIFCRVSSLSIPSLPQSSSQRAARSPPQPSGETASIPEWQPALLLERQRVVPQVPNLPFAVADKAKLDEIVAQSFTPEEKLNMMAQLLDGGNDQCFHVLTEKIPGSSPRGNGYGEQLLPPPTAPSPTTQPPNSGLIAQ